MPPPLQILTTTTNGKCCQDDKRAIEFCELINVNRFALLTDHFKCVQRPVEKIG